MKPENLGNGYVKLSPDAGCAIQCVIDERVYSEVVCREHDKTLYVEIEKTTKRTEPI